MSRKELQALKGRLDSVFSRYIRLRDSDKNGVGKCITCGESVKWSQASCGHFFSRSHNSTRYNELNCHLQCKDCNNKEGAAQGSELKKIYAQRLEERFGKGTLNKLNFIQSKIRVEITPELLHKLLKIYNKKVKDLIDEKNSD